ncbi:MAG TPA: hypothetical protein VNY73_10600, partial [Bacteroidia bacterium]|nr:hypothetical protein [Bacteroidia bacterium]
FRIIFVVLITSFHIGISLTLFVGLFYLISIACLIGLLPKSVMDKFDTKFNLNKSNNNDSPTPSFMQKIRANYYFKVALNCLLFFFAALSMIWNLSTVANSGLGISPDFFPVGYALRLNQNWGMFAPTVLKDDGWYVLEGITKNKIKIDIARKGKPTDYTKPESILQYIPDDRWRKFLENYMLAQNSFMRHYYCNYLLKDWNSKNPGNKIDSLTIIYMKEFTLPPGMSLTVKKEILCGCKN